MADFAVLFGLAGGSNRASDMLSLLFEFPTHGTPGIVVDSCISYARAGSISFVPVVMRHP